MCRPVLSINQLIQARWCSRSNRSQDVQPAPSLLAMSTWLYKHVIPVLRNTFWARSSTMLHLRTITHQGMPFHAWLSQRRLNLAFDEGLQVLQPQNSASLRASSHLPSSGRWEPQETQMGGLPLMSFSRPCRLVACSRRTCRSSYQRWGTSIAMHAPQWAKPVVQCEQI